MEKMVIKKKNSELLKNEMLGDKLIKKGFWLYLFTYIIAPTSYLIRVIVSNSVSVEEVGILYSIISFITLISVYNDLGLTESLQYFLPRFWITKKYNFIKTSIFISLIVQTITGLMIILFLLWGSQWLGTNYFKHESAKQLLEYFCFYFLGINFFQIIQSIFISFQDTFRFKIVEFIKTISILVFTISFFVLGYSNIIYYGLAWIIGLFLGLIIAFYLFYKKYFILIEKGKISYDKVVFKKYFKYALWVFLGANAGSLLGQIDLQMVIAILGPTMAGYYANYLSLINISNIFVGPILGLIFPIVSELIIKKDFSKLIILQNFLYTYMLIFSLTLSGIFVSLGLEISTILFGEKFILSGKLLSLGGFFVGLNILFSINFGIMAGLGKVRQRVLIILTVGILNVIMNFIFIKIWGIYGVIISSILGIIIMFITTFIIINKHQQISIRKNIIIKNIIFILLLSTIIFYIKNRIFIIDDMFRYQNFLYILILIGIYYIFLGILNYKQILILKNEILITIRK